MEEDKHNEAKQMVLVSFDSEIAPEVMVISFPLKAFADNRLSGTALLRGSFDEMKMLALNKVGKLRSRAMQRDGIIKPGVLN